MQVALVLVGAPKAAKHIIFALSCFKWTLLVPHNFWIENQILFGFDVVGLSPGI